MWIEEGFIIIHEFNIIPYHTYWELFEWELVEMVYGGEIVLEETKI